MKLLICVLALVGSARAATCTLTAGTYASWAATSGFWTGVGCPALPAAPDIIIVPAAGNPTLHVASGESVDLGSNVAGVGDAITIQGTNSATFGSVNVDPGGVLKVRSFDSTTNRLGVVQRFAHFTNSGTVIGAPKAGTLALLQCTGICAGAGSGGTPAVFTNDTADWSVADSTTRTSLSNNGNSSPSSYYAGGSVYAAMLLDPWISNAGGTAIGSFGDSSLSFTSQSCTPTCTDTFLTTEVATLAAVTSTGKYYVDYRLGFIWWWMDSGAGKTVTFTGNYKRLSFTPWAIFSDSSLTYSAGTFDYTNFYYMGWTDSSSGGVVYLKFKNMAGTSQTGSVTNSRFDYCYRPVAIGTSNGTAGSPVLIDNNYMDCGAPLGASDGCVFLTNSSQSYITITNNRQIGGGGDGGVLFLNANSAGTWDHLAVRYNVAQTAKFAIGSGDITGSWPDADISHNAVLGIGSLVDSRCFAGIWGTSGHPASLASNLAVHCMRGVNFGGYLNETDNTLLDTTHHGHSAPFQSTTNETQFSNVTVTGNVVTGVGYSLLDFGYNRNIWGDVLTATHNTLAGTAPNWTFTDSSDGLGANLVTKLTFKDNLITGSPNGGVLRVADTAVWMSRLHFTAADWNNVAGNTPNYSGWNRWATFTGITNVAGVSLADPSASVAFSGKTLAWTYTSATDHTLAWDGGTPVQLVLATGTATAGANSTSNGTLTNGGASFATALNSASTPTGCWIKITGGTGSGQIRRIMKNTATVLTVAPAWTTTPDATSTYAIVKSEVTLTAGDTSTVQGGIDYRSAPTSTQSDTSVAMALNSTSMPTTYAYTSGSLALWDAAKGGTGTEMGAWARLLAAPSLIDEANAFIRRGFTPSDVGTWCGGSDGETIGAQQFCAAGKRLIGAIQ